MQGMIMHHAQAVEMTALIESHTENKDLLLLGARISHSQSEEIKFMQRWLQARGEAMSMPMPDMPDMDMPGMDMSSHQHHMLMPGMLTPKQMDALRKAKGAAFDRLFLTGMIQHHSGALVMVKDLFDTAGAGPGCRAIQFHNGCRQRPASRDQDNARHVEGMTYRGDNDESSTHYCFLFTAILSYFVLRSFCGRCNRTEALPSAPPLPAGMTGSDANDPRAKLVAGNL